VNILIIIVSEQGIATLPLRKLIFTA